MVSTHSICNIGGYGHFYMKMMMDNYDGEDDEDGDGDDDDYPRLLADVDPVNCKAGCRSCVLEDVRRMPHSIGRIFAKKKKQKLRT